MYLSLEYSIMCRAFCGILTFDSTCLCTTVVQCTTTMYNEHWFHVRVAAYFNCCTVYILLLVCIKNCIRFTTFIYVQSAVFQNELALLWKMYSLWVNYRSLFSIPFLLKFPLSKLFFNSYTSASVFVATCFWTKFKKLLFPWSNQAL